MEENLEKNDNEANGYIKNETLVQNSGEIKVNCDISDVGFGECKENRFVVSEETIPKKNWWQNSVCKECGKEFKSVKAVFGHMRKHPKPKRKAENEKGEVVELSNPARKKRSGGRKCKVNPSFNCNNNVVCGLSFDASCSSVSYDVDNDNDDEETEVAACLLLLAQGSRSCALDVDDDHEVVSDNGHVNLELSLAVGCSQMRNDSDNVGGESAQRGRGRGRDGCGYVVEGMRCCDFGLGYVSFDENVTEFQGFDGGGVSRVDVESVELGLISGMENLVLDAEMKDETNGDANDDQTNVVTDKLTSRASDSNAEDPSHGYCHICNICGKSFRSGKALGGHRMQCPYRRCCPPESPTSVVEARGQETVISFDQKADCGTVKLQRSENHQVKKLRSTKKAGKDTVNSYDQKADCGSVELQRSEHRVKKLGSAKKVRKFTCRICSKEFPSGQALGGHMSGHIKVEAHSVKVVPHENEEIGIGCNSDLELSAPVDHSERQVCEPDMSRSINWDQTATPQFPQPCLVSLVLEA